MGKYKEYLENWLDETVSITFSEANPVLHNPNSTNGSGTHAVSPAPSFSTTITGKVQKFEDNIDTDAIIPAQFMPGKDDQDLGTHAFQYVRPEFAQKVKEGNTIIVAGAGFGSGSSREEAPRALKGAGIKAVIAKSYAYIYSRNQV